MPWDDEVKIEEKWDFPFFSKSQNAKFHHRFPHFAG